MNDWYHINETLYNDHLTWQQNQQNGCNLPDDRPVLIFDSDKPRYFVGYIKYSTIEKRLCAYESVHGNLYGGVRFLYWTYFNMCDKTVEDVLK